MSFIDTIEIKNFKSIRHQKIEGCKRINLFIGYPNVGKSNMLEALSLLSMRENKYESFHLIRKDGPASLFFNGSVNRIIEIIVNDQYSFQGKYLNDILKFQFESDKLPAGNNELFRRFEFLGNEIAGFYQNSNVKNFGLAEVKRYEFEKNVKYTVGSLSALIDPYEENLFELFDSNEGLRKDVSELFKPYELKLVFDRESRQLKIMKTINDDTIYLTSFQMVADTLKRLIFFKAASFTNQKSILLFEEPEAHLFPPYIRKFTSDLIYSSTNQYFISTDSPYVFNTLIEDAIHELSVYLVDYRDGETKINLLTNDEIHEIRTYGVDLFFNLESYLKYGSVNIA